MPQRSQPIVYPYIPNSVPATKAAMIAAVGARNVEEFYADIPPALRLKGKLDVPEPILSEAGLVRHIQGLLDKNVIATERLSFLGAACYQHHVPAMCDEINSRGEFLTAYAGEPYEDKGRFQALFEYESMMGELLNMDVVNVPTYDQKKCITSGISTRNSRLFKKSVEFIDGSKLPPPKAVALADCAWKARSFRIGF